MSRPWHLELGDGRLLRCRVIRHARYRRVGLRVTPEELRISAPQAASERELRGIVEEHRDWAQAALARLEAARPRDAIHGDPLPRLLPLRAIGAQWPVAYATATGSRLRVTCRDGNVTVLAPAEAGETDLGEALRRWLMREARRHFAPRLNGLASGHGLEYGRLSIRAQRSRWGSCSGRGDISLNYRLLFLPPALVDYVLLHELAHTVERNHSARFWGVLEEMLPGARDRDRELDASRALIPAWSERY
ncbi:MAG: M48 family metallopeptidase [Gammaproteobacteria bacterium]|nr:M48 family metallopeptidase [Gammaproteobacteria bacterium]MDX5375186.1 M48 family metallopeptidase [Gammaproteobacteria bacterium]